jgi:hypothetical protein
MRTAFAGARRCLHRPEAQACAGAGRLQWRHALQSRRGLGAAAQSVQGVAARVRGGGHTGVGRQRMRGAGQWLGVAARIGQRHGTLAPGERVFACGRQHVVQLGQGLQRPPQAQACGGRVDSRRHALRQRCQRSH